ncbi:hypothetical protein DEDE109153_04535 [Deinococcus deserti]|uniref:Uncharacterized protein n=1 Tax=Deinococcus deserti (strain DSM 17065 / CIP 109153 / LMG 22923 / VCD115) TaxID=546414 RepID=C1D0Y2_DEIDV|nr:hypothetical protein [Deinococcus deserti]ACO45506.1 Hypothetical protein Deide_06551 [Deinococcus deserti VCD115]
MTRPNHQQRALAWQLPLLIALFGALIWLLWPQVRFYTAPENRMARICRNDVKCINKKLQELVASRGPKEALRVAVHLSNIEPLADHGHTFAHEVGYATYKKYPTLSEQIQACDDTLGSGCYHGVMMLFISKPGNADADLSKTCAPFAGKKPHAMYTDCVHGIGHGLMMQALMLKGKDAGWKEIQAALKGCRRIRSADSTEYSFCSGGVFMEYRVAATMNTFHYPNPPRYPKNDVHWPCSKVSGVARISCYSYQGTLIALEAPSLAAAFKVCAEAGGEAARQCASSIGRDRVTGDLHLDTKRTTEICGAAAHPDLRETCFIDSAQYYLYLDRNIRGALRMCRLPGIVNIKKCEKTVRDAAKKEYSLSI